MSNGTRTVNGWKLEQPAGKGWWKCGDWHFEIDESFGGDKYWYAGKKDQPETQKLCGGLRKAVAYAQAYERKADELKAKEA